MVEDAPTVEQLDADEPAAWRGAIAILWARGMSYLAKRGLDPHDQEDMTQEAVMAYRRQFSGNRQWLGWAGTEGFDNSLQWYYRVLANKRADHFRATGRRSDLNQALSDEGRSGIRRNQVETPSQEQKPTPLLGLVNAERRRSLRRCLRSLGSRSKEQARVLCLHYFHGLKTRDIADRIEVAHGTICARLSAGRAGLRRVAQSEGLE